VLGALKSDQLRWWIRDPHPPPHSALAELGRLKDPYLIAALALLIERLMPDETKPRGWHGAEKPPGTKEVARAIRSFRLLLTNARKASRSQQAD
jgi:hypothetical protein